MGTEKRKVEIPNDWSGISIQMYQKFEELKKKNLKEDEFNVEVLGVVCGLDREMIERMEAKSLNKVLKSLKFLAVAPKEDELQKRVEWNGVTYGFIPNLSEITMGEYIDIEQHCKEAHKNLHKIMSVLYRPIVKETKTRYSVEPYSPNDEIDEEFLDFPILPSISALSFFFHLGKKLPVALVRYLRKDREKLRARA
jgi:hypothetical protein